MAEQDADSGREQRVRGTAMKRRGILAAAGAVVAGIALAPTASRVAADGQAVTTGGSFSYNNPIGLTGSVSSALYGIGPTAGLAGIGSGANSVGVDGTAPIGGVGMRGSNPTSSAIFPGNVGVLGTNTNSGGIGVMGEIPARNGSANTVAVQGNNQSTGAGGMGVQGIAQTGYGVGGFSGGVGVYGLSSGSYGIVGVTTAGSPFSGITGSANTPGAAAFAGGTSTAGCYAAYFTGPVVVDGAFTVINPVNKHGAIKHSDGSYRLLYSMESPESWVEDFGKGQVVNGQAMVALDKDFAAIAQTDDYTVVPIPEGDCNGLYITNKSAVGFEVRELRGGTSGVAFRYRIVAKPKTDNKTERLATFTMPNITIPTVHDLPKPPPAPTGGTAASPPQPSARPAPPAASTPTSGTQGTAQNPVQPISPPCAV